MTPIIACDPGKSGGIAYMDQEGIVTASSMPDTEGDVYDHIQSLVAGGARPVCVMERVRGFMGAKAPGSAMFNFGMGYGFIQGVLMGMGVPLELVDPAKWQKTFSLGKKSECSGTTEWKNKLKSEAQRRFPHLKVTLGTADALLILSWKMDKLDRT